MNVTEGPTSEESRESIEKSLDATERRFEDWRCLIGIAGGLCLLSSAAFIFVIVRGDLERAVVIGSVAAAFLCVVWGLSQMLSVAVLLGMISFAPLFVWIAFSTQSNETLLDSIAIFAGCLAVVAPIMIVAFHVITGSAGEKALIALPKGRTFGAVSSIQAIFGVHPVSLYLSSRFRRITALGLFGVCQFVLGLSVIIALLFVPFVLVGLVQSFEVARSEIAFRLGELVGAIIAPFFWLPIFIGIAAGLRYCARYLSRTSLELMVSKDARAPILFLRSFSDDQVRLVRPKRGLLARLVLLGEPRPTLDHILLEEGTPEGPVVAIGAPGSHPPFGAARAYVSEDDWKGVVSDLAQRSNNVIMAIDETAGIQWEWNEMLRAKFSPKVLYLLPPRLTFPTEARRVVANLRAASHPPTDLFDGLQRFLDGNTRPCIGWCFGESGRLTVYTTLHPSENSYRIAVRDDLREVTGGSTRHAERPTHNAMGIASFVAAIAASVLTFLLFAYANVVTAKGQADSTFNENVGHSLFALWFVQALTVVVGITGLLDRSSKKVFPILGIIIGGAVFLLSTTLLYVTAKIGLRN